MKVPTRKARPHMNSSLRVTLKFSLLFQMCETRKGWSPVPQPHTREECHTDYHCWSGAGCHCGNPIRTTNVKRSIKTVGMHTEIYLEWATKDSYGPMDASIYMQKEQKQNRHQPKHNENFRQVTGSISQYESDFNQNLKNFKNSCSR